MRNRALFTLLALAIVSPLCCLSSYGANALLDDNVPLSLIAFLLITLISLAAAAWFGNYLYNLSRSAKAAVLLAETMGLAPLNKEGAAKWAWFGGSVDGYRFGISTVHRLMRYTLDGQSRVRFTYQLRTVIPLRSSDLKAVMVVRPYNARAGTDDFATAFPRQAHADRLTEPARQAMLAFVSSVEKKGCTSLNLFGPKGRSLGLYSRETIPPGVVAPGVFAAADLLLVHDQADAIYVTPEQLLKVVRELILIARQLPGR